MTTKELVEVVQADRDAVQAFHREMGERLLADIKNGTNTLEAKGEDSDPIYQHFARHRLSAEAAIVAWLREEAVALEQQSYRHPARVLHQSADTLEQGKIRHG